MKKIILLTLFLSVSCISAWAQFNLPSRCDNLDFNRGDFTNWTGKQSVYPSNYADASNCSSAKTVTVVCPDGTGPSCNGCFSHPLFKKPVPAPATNVGPVASYTRNVIEAGRLTIMTKQNEFDPFTCGTVPTIPPGEKYAARVGNGGINPNNPLFYPQGCTKPGNPDDVEFSACNYAPGQAGWTDGVGFQIDYLSYRFHVNRSNALLIYKYATVFQEPKDTILTKSGQYDGSHTNNIRPGIEVTLKLDDGNIMGRNCSCGFNACYEETPSLSECQPTDYQKLGGKVYGEDTRITYLPWTTVGVDLRRFIGQYVTLEFMTRDCGWGDHFGYAYVSAKCDTFAIKSKMINGKMIASAPEGFKYRWFPNRESTKEIELLNYQPGDSVSVELMDRYGCVNTLGSKIYPSNNTSINNSAFQSTNTTLQVYPNPTNSELQLSGSQKLKSYTVLNHLGAVVLAGNLEQRSSIFVNALANGLYFIKVKDVSGNELQTKFVKE